MVTVERSESLPVSREVDVLVAGGGPAGFSAAFAAARMGARTLVVEQFGCLGGIATAGGHNHICLYSAWGSDERVVGGVIWEAAERVRDRGWGVLTNSSADFELEGLKLVLEEMAEGCGAELLYYTHVADAVVEDGRIAGVVVQNKTGRSVIRAKRVVDCTGDGDVAARAGCSFDVGDEETGLMQPVTLMFTVGGVDWERVKVFRGSDYNLKDVWKAAQDAGDMRPFQSQIMGWWWTPTRPDQVGMNFTHANNVDGTRAEDLTRATVEARRQAYETIEVCRKYIPGMEECHMISTPPTVGVRETRRIAGLYTLTKEDLLDEREFDDSIGYGSFFIDIHNTKGPGMDVKTHRPRK
ncbi:MAG: FAD-dependent oxidoreductase, partial [Planctomycetota bacterium]